MPRVLRLAELGGSDGKGVVVRDIFTFAPGRPGRRLVPRPRRHPARRRRVRRAGHQGGPEHLQARRRIARALSRRRLGVGPPRVASSSGLPGALQRPEVVDHQHPLKVVVLVLDRDREEPLGLELERPTVLVLRPDPDARRALDLLAHPGEAQAALAPGDGLVPLEDLRVDEHAQVARLFFVGDVDDEELVGHPDLRGGQADPGAAYMVSAMSLTSSRIAGVTAEMGSPFVRRRLSG